MPRYKLSTSRRSARFGNYANFKAAVRESGGTEQRAEDKLRQHLQANRAPGKAVTMVSAPNAGYIGDTLAP
jgi:hypothetical protein